MVLKMKNHLTNKFPSFFLAIFLVLSSFTTAVAQDIEGDAANGMKIFKAKCAACHKLDKKFVGPALGDVTQRRELDWLILWIRDNKALRESGDKDAIKIFEDYSGSVMTPFPELSDQDIKDILRYTIDGDPNKKEKKDETPVPPSGDDDNTALLFILGGILLLLVILLARVKNTLKQIKGDPTSTIISDADVITRTALKNPKIVTVLTILIAVFLLQQTYFALMSVGVQQAYQPEQPIKFSHKLHAGDNKIDCNYCHYGARKGKHSNIPAANVCMNCHMYIQEGPKYGTEEIAKIYDAVGYDPENAQYIEDYEQKPIKWVRIHNLPDLAYFNHSQHVTAGQVECQTCHGPIEEMEEVYQHADLTMGWCINCHRETEVQVETNEYYSEMHERLKAKYGKDAKITVDMIGGLECGKCHY